MSFAPLLGVMKFDQTPISFSLGTNLLPFPGGFVLEQVFRWFQDVGSFAMIGLFFWVLNAFVNPVYDYVNGTKKNRLVSNWMLMFMGLAMTVYVVALLLLLKLSALSPDELSASRNGKVLSNMEWAYELSFAIAGLCAILALLGPFVVDLFQMRAGRIYAIAKLSFKEAFRRRIVWVFLSILLLYLFPARWFFAVKPEDELKSIIDNTTRGMNVLLISVGLLLTSFSIPSDIKNLTIHTIVTKPVQRFEIVLGRFFGYLGLVTIAMFMMTGAGLVLINAGNISEEATEESLKSRVALYGEMQFSSRTAGDFKGIDVGREDTYRKYIAGNSPHTAVWAFRQVPGSTTQAEAMPVEFAFDVYRTTKGEEGVGVSVSFDFMTHNWDPARNEEFINAMQGLGNVRPQDANWEKVEKIALEYGRYIWKNLQIYDYHTSSIPVPAGLYRNANTGTLGTDTQSGNQKYHRLYVSVKCDTPTQFVGVNQYDLYILRSEGNFSFNYFKGSIGLWFRLIIALSISIACSTYLAGVLSFLVALFVFVIGFFLEFINEIALGGNVGGGPMESLARLIKNNVAAAELDPTPTVKTLQLFDILFRWIFRRVMSLFPNIDRLGMSEYVAQGFNLDPMFLLLNLIFVLGYAFPWLVAGYYMMKAREIAA